MITATLFARRQCPWPGLPPQPASLPPRSPRSPAQIDLDRTLSQINAALAVKLARAQMTLSRTLESLQADALALVRSLSSALRRPRSKPRAACSTPAAPARTARRLTAPHATEPSHHRQQETGGILL